MHLEDIHQNLALLKEQDEAYKVAGFIWMQGENDATLEEAANSYADNLKILITKYRTTFNQKEMPAIFGQINSRYGIKDGAKTVRQQMELAEKNIENSYLIKTSTDETWLDFPKHSDNVHYNAEGQLRLGTKFANELIKMIN